MATYGRYDAIPGLVASSTFAAKQYYLAKVASTAGAVIPASSATSVILGAMQNDPAANEAADVGFLGIVKVAAETSVAYGSALTASTTGRAKATTTNGHHILGFALEGSSSAGDIIRAIAVPGFYRST